MTKHFSRVQTYSSVADKVYIIAPPNNGYWQEWKPWFSEHHDTYRPTFHYWCNLGIHDKDTGKLVNHRTLFKAATTLCAHIHVNAKEIELTPKTCGNLEMMKRKLLVKVRHIRSHTVFGPPVIFNY